ncbi:Cytosol aminopeptidase [bioreactor metagenome]|uniref:leucyl aminopeptidase n=1 Tax=bioreactor metagenome TaxID=1076179 RepID=A0A644XVJ8_9ZZZZ
MVSNILIESAVVLPVDVFCDTLIIGLFEDSLNSEDMSRAYGKPLANLINSIFRDQPECSRFAETSIIYNTTECGAKRIILIGLGTKAKLTLDKIRELSATAIRAAKKLKSRTVATAMYNSDHNLSDAAISIIQGAILGGYEFNNYKTDPKASNVEKMIIVGPDLRNDQHWLNMLEDAKIIADGVNLARDLTNHPSCFMNPSQMAFVARNIASQCGFEINVLDKCDMEKQKMNAMLAVTRGSETPPKLITLKYLGNPQSKELISFVGKGITFDSGGISLKPSEKMGDMKGDMAGGAAVLGAMQAIGHLKPKANILAIIPCSENMPSGHAFKPGDVISSMSGKTIEIISTDAEGRLLLADAITYARKLGATKIVDLATLTGACVVALGNVASGLISNSDDWSQEVIRASKQTGEKVWPLPTFDEYLGQIKSDIADLKNSGGRMAGTITAGLFIKQFVDDLPWVHIDIAGTSDIDKISGYNVKGATGVGVRTLIQLAQNLSTDAC